MLTPRTTLRVPKLFSTLCTARYPARGADRGADAPLVRGAAFAGAGREAGFSARGNSRVGEGAARASGGASRSGPDNLSPLLSPSAVISSREAAKPLPRFAGRRR